MTYLLSLSVEGQDKPLLFQGGVLVDLSFTSTGSMGKKMDVLDNKKKKNVEKVLTEQFCDLNVEPSGKSCKLQILAYRVIYRTSCG